MKVLRTVCMLTLLCAWGAPHAMAQSADAPSENALNASRPWQIWTRVETGKWPESYTDSVRAVQFLLRARGEKIAVDGIYGVQTQNAIRRVQRQKKLAESGDMTAATWEAIVPKLRTGSRGDAVRALQTLLNGFDYKTPVDGIFGAKTRAQVLEFQKAAQVARDGIVGVETWSNLSIGYWQGC